MGALRDVLVTAVGMVTMPLLDVLVESKAQRQARARLVAEANRRRAAR